MIEILDRETNKQDRIELDQARRDMAVKVLTGQVELGNGRHVMNRVDVDIDKFLTPDSRPGTGSHLPEVPPKRVE